MCVQEPRWKGSKARSTRGGFKLLYHGVNRMGRELSRKKDYVNNVVEEKRMSSGALCTPHRLDVRLEEKEE